MAEVLPAAANRLDIDDLLRLAAPRPMLVISASDDPYSQDASEMVRLARPAYAAENVRAALEHTEYQGGHAVTRERVDRIVEWVTVTAMMGGSARPSHETGLVDANEFGPLP